VAAYQAIWFVLWGVLWAVYFMLDGFDLGAGILEPFLGRNDSERRVIVNTVGPVWDGNEVWLITAGGATFAAFPEVYASLFSYLYTPLLLILFALIVRGVAFEFRGKVEGAGWRRLWDGAIFVGSLVPALLFGVAFGNIFQGIPMDADGYHGSLLGLLNPYGLMTGALFVLLFLVHGSLWLSMRAGSGIGERSHALAGKLWYLLLVVAVAFLVYTNFATDLYNNYMFAKVMLVLPAAAVLGLLGIKVFLAAHRAGWAFLSSCVTIVMVVFTGLFGLYPRLLPSSLDPAYTLNAFNASSSEYTLKIMTVVALIFVPIVIAYQILIYRVFRGKLSVEDVQSDTQAY
jgi:cytochrome d ubiquinol oxidase subunit II